MSFKLLGGGSSLETVVSDVNQNILELKGQEVTKVIKDETGTRVVILDKDGLRTTQPGAGIDVFTAEDGDLTFNSANNVLKVVQTGTVTLSKGASTDSVDVSLSHGLDTIPVVLSFAQLGQGVDNYLPLPFTTIELSGAIAGLVAQIVTFNVTSTDITWNISAPNYVGNVKYTQAIDLTIRYYILQETAN